MSGNIYPRKFPKIPTNPKNTKKTNPVYAFRRINLPLGSLVSLVFMSEGYDFIFQITWMANDADILLTLADNSRNEISLLKQPISTPKTLGIREALGNQSDCDTFSQLISELGVENILGSPHNIREVCFTKTRCVKLTRSMRKHLRESSQRNRHFSFIVPTNEAIGNATKELNSVDTKMEFVRSHVFVGTLGELSGDQKEQQLYYSLSQRHEVMTGGLGLGQVVPGAGAGAGGFRVREKMKVREGTLFIIENNK